MRLRNKKPMMAARTMTPAPTPTQIPITEDLERPEPDASLAAASEDVGPAGGSDVDFLDDVVEVEVEDFGVAEAEDVGDAELVDVCPATEDVDVDVGVNVPCAVADETEVVVGVVACAVSVVVVCAFGGVVVCAFVAAGAGGNKPVQKAPEAARNCRTFSSLAPHGLAQSRMP